MIDSIRDRRTFERFRSEGERARHDWLQLSILPPHTAGEVRIAFAIGRKTGSAVVRNRLRRQLRHQLTHLGQLADSPLAPGDYLVIVNQPVTVTSGELATALVKVLTNPRNTR